MIDFFGHKAKAELEAFKASSERIDAARREEVNRLGALLQSTIMKLLALTDRDAFRSVKAAEDPGVQKELPSSPFARRGSLASALQKSREVASDAVSS